MKNNVFEEIIEQDATTIAIEVYEKTKNKAITFENLEKVIRNKARVMGYLFGNDERVINAAIRKCVKMLTA